MPYAGQTYRVPCSRGGWNANPNEDLVPPEGMVYAENINLHRGGRETRGGVEKVNAISIVDQPKVMGVFQFRLSNGNEFIVTGCTNGKVYKDYTTLLHTFATTGKRITFTVYNNTLYIWNGANVGQTWDGEAATTSDIANPAADWTGTNHPKAAIVHGRGASKRLWAYGCPTDPKILYVSANGTDNFVTGVVTLSIETGDGFGVVALSEFSEQLIAIGKTRPYLIDDEDVDTDKWGYRPAKWLGGAAHDRLVVRTPNDLIAMEEDGEIYSVIKAQSSGDFHAVSMARPAHIDTWVKANVDLSQIDDFFMVYDRTLRAVKIFVIRNDKTEPDCVLVYFIDRPHAEAWTNHRFYKTDFAVSATEVRVAAGNWKIYTGGQSGHVYELESSTISDDGVYFYSGFLMPEISFDDPRGEKMYDRALLVMRQSGTEDVRENLWIDGNPVASAYTLADESGNLIADESGNNIVGHEFDTYTFALKNTAHTLSRANRFQTGSHVIGMKGKRIQSEIFQNAVGEKMFISQVLYDHQPLGIGDV